MVGKPNYPLLDNAVEIYLTGKSAKEVHALTGVSSKRLWTHLSRRGIEPRGNRIHDLPTGEIVMRYRDGESVLALAEAFSVSRAVIAKRLTQHGVVLRSCSEGQLSRHWSTTPEQRSAMASAAHEAVRGRTRSIEERVAGASTRAKVASFGSDQEALLFDLLAERGLVFDKQTSCGPYNFDLALNPVAVEVLGGNWHASKPTHQVRTPYLLNEGWNLVFIWTVKGISTISPKAADYVISFFEEISRNPSDVREYRVIWGTGELVASGSAEDDDFALKYPSRRLLSRRT